MENVANTVVQNTDCKERFERKYKFYLGFGNSYCQEYATEKYHRTMKYELIPIVYGRANFSQIGLPGTLINILDYRSPKHLVDYLHYLSQTRLNTGDIFRREWPGRASM